MKAVIQRVLEASVTINEKVVSKIKNGLLVLVGIVDEDSKDDIDWLTKKIVNLRIFNDRDGVMNYSLKDIDGEILIISQFTLMALTKKGNRPSYIKAAKGDFAKNIYDKFLIEIKSNINKEPKAGIFGADMLVKIENDGPVTIFMDSKNKSL